MALVNRKDRWELLESMLGEVKDFDTSQNSFIHQALACAALELDLANRDIAIASEKFDVTKLFGKDLDEGVFQRTGIVRKMPSKADGEVVISGKDGSKIPIGTSLFAGDLEFVTREEVTIVNSQAKVLVQAKEAGYEYNVPPGAIDTIDLEGVVITSVNNFKAFYTGRDMESDWELKERCLKMMREPAKAGNLHHFEEWVGDIPGVYACKAFRRWKNQQTVRVVVAVGEGRPAGEEDIERIYKVLEERQVIPFGANLLIEPVETIDLNLSLDISLSQGYELKDVKEEITDNLEAFLIDKLFKVDRLEDNKEITVLSYAEIGSIIFKTLGVDDYENLRVNGGTNNIRFRADTLGVVKDFELKEV